MIGFNNIDIYFLISRDAINNINIVPVKKNPPAKKVPDISTRAPMIRGAVNPPTSLTQKNIPPAEPIYPEPTSGVSIKINTNIGRIIGVVNP